MARCDQGYLCDVCGAEVETITESDLYLRFVIGEVQSSRLLSTPDRHIRCNPVTAQFIDHPDFSPPVTVEGDFDRRLFDPADITPRVALVTRGWLRLKQLAALPEPLPLAQYPLPEFHRASR